FQAEDGIRDGHVTGVQTCALPISNRRLKPGPKGPRAELIRAVVEMKQRNPDWGCPRIAQQIALAFHIQINKDVVRRILGHHYQRSEERRVGKEYRTARRA